MLLGSLILNHTPYPPMADCLTIKQSSMSHTRIMRARVPSHERGLIHDSMNRYSITQSDSYKQFNGLAGDSFHCLITSCFVVLYPFDFIDESFCLHCPKIWRYLASPKRKASG